MERAPSRDQEDKNSTNIQIHTLETFFYKHFIRSILILCSLFLEFVLCVFQYVNDEYVYCVIREYYFLCI